MKMPIYSTCIDAHLPQWNFEQRKLDSRCLQGTAHLDSVDENWQDIKSVASNLFKNFSVASESFHGSNLF